MFDSKEEIEKYKKFRAQQRPPNPVFLKVFEKMVANGDLEGLDDDAALEKVVGASEQIMDE